MWSTLSCTMRTCCECLIKAAEMDRLADTCLVAAEVADYEELAAYWRGLARLAALPNEAALAEAALHKYLRQKSH